MSYQGVYQLNEATGQLALLSFAAVELPSLNMLRKEMLRICYKKFLASCKENLYGLLINGDEARIEFFALMKLCHDKISCAKTGNQLFTAIMLPNLLLQKPGYKLHILDKFNAVHFAFSEFIQVTIGQKTFWHADKVEKRHELLEQNSLRRTKILDAVTDVIELMPWESRLAVEQKYRDYLEIDQLDSLERKLSLILRP